jgi:NAD(P)-dependent dehydrogenase (short-subunit alcohol dehydrogenase family)
LSNENDNTHSHLQRQSRIGNLGSGRAALLMQQPAKRTGSPAEVAEAVVWLCSDSASFVNGHNMVVDGGYLAQ